MLKPVEKLKEFLDNWKNKDWEAMFAACQMTWKENNKVQALIDLYPADLVQFAIQDKIQSSSEYGLLVRISFNTVTHFHGQIQTRARLAVVVKEIKAYTPSRKGIWGVNPISILRGKTL